MIAGACLSFRSLEIVSDMVGEVIMTSGVAPHQLTHYFLDGAVSRHGAKSDDFSKRWVRTAGLR